MEESNLPIEVYQHESLIYLGKNHPHKSPSLGPQKNLQTWSNASLFQNIDSGKFVFLSPVENRTLHIRCCVFTLRCAVVNE